MSAKPNSQGLDLRFSRMDRSGAHEIAHWRYPPPYDIYNLESDDETVRYALDPKNKFFVMRNKDNQIVGFCSFGQDAQVPGGDYSREALDIGMGLRPELTGQGLGTHLAAEVISHARSLYAHVRFRVTIAFFNRRAQRVWTQMGFQPVQNFTHQESGRDFVVMVWEDTERNKL